MLSNNGNESNIVNTKELYSVIYKADGHNYGQYTGSPANQIRTNNLLAIVNKHIISLNINENDTVVEIGAGLGELHLVHKNWMGFEYSTTAIELARQTYGPSLKIFEGDARNLPIASGSVDFAFSFATFEHIPEVEKAFFEIERIIKPGGVAMLAPAWNCRAWTVKKLQQRPYQDLTATQKIGKFLIPLRDNLLFRMICSMPSRVLREVKLLCGMPIYLDYTKLEPDFTLWEKYPHISDDDAFVSMDAHAALAYFVFKKWEVLSHGSIWKRLTCRGNEIVVRKKK
jgi:SAM-dependent methyltransferase